MHEKNLSECTRPRDKQSGISLKAGFWLITTNAAKKVLPSLRSYGNYSSDSDYIVNIEKVVALRNTQIFL